MTVLSGVLYSPFDLALHSPVILAVLLSHLLHCCLLVPNNQTKHASERIILLFQSQYYLDMLLSWRNHPNKNTRQHFHATHNPAQKQGRSGRSTESIWVSSRYQDLPADMCQGGNTKLHPVLSWGSTFLGGTTAQLGILSIHVHSSRPRSTGWTKCLPQWGWDSTRHRQLSNHRGPTKFLI